MIKIKLLNGGFVEITQKQIDGWQRIYKEINVESEVTEIAELFNNGTMKKKSEKGTLKYINEFLNDLNEIEKYGEPYFDKY